LEKTDLTANRRDPLLSGPLASGPFLKDKLLALVEPYPDGRTGFLASSPWCKSGTRSANPLAKDEMNSGAAGHS
jgi:hypothetical protein